MFLKTLKLTNFRNFSNLDFEFKTSLTVLVGNNAQGKSNLLESIYFLATTKSPKADKDEQLVKRDEIFLRVQGTVDRGQPPEASLARSGGEETELEIAMQQIPESGLIKRVKVNGVARRVVDYIGNLSVVTFSPEDINLVTGPPALRRWHIDLTLAQIDKEYKKVITEYEDVVKRKNKVLKAIKEGFSKVEELTFWIDQQISLGQKISQKRKLFFEFLNNTERKFGEFEFEYLGNELSEQRLNEYKNREIASSSSLIGPHRDDFRFTERTKTDDLRDLAHFGSRGEHRTAVLDLKISEVSFIESVAGERPILLLDDVFSELDLTHREHVIDLIFQQQTIIAAVELDPYLETALSEAAIYFVENGQLSEITDR